MDSAAARLYFFLPMNDFPIDSSPAAAGGAADEGKTSVQPLLDGWRMALLRGDFRQFIAGIENNPRLLKDHQPELIRFIDGIMRDLVKADPSAAEAFISALRGKIEETQLGVWLIRVRKPIESAPTKKMNPPFKPDFLKPAAAIRKRLSIPRQPRPVPALLAGLLIAFALVAGFMIRPLASKLWTGRQAKKQAPVTMEAAAVGKAAAIAPQGAPPGGGAKAGEARVMLVNASSMFQKGMAAKARGQLIAKGFSPENVLVGTHSDKVSRVYGYYSAREYIPVLKEIFSMLYPGKPPGFLDLSPQERTINGWIRRSFHDERLNILIRMPNEE
jgi:hypothetical protein